MSENRRADAGNTPFQCVVEPVEVVVLLGNHALQHQLPDVRHHQPGPNHHDPQPLCQEGTAGSDTLVCGLLGDELICSRSKIIETRERKSERKRERKREREGEGVCVCVCVCVCV